MGNWQRFELELKADAPEAVERMEAWWQGAILDRPTVQITAPCVQRPALPESSHTSHAERWCDVDYVLRRAEAQMRGTWFGGESMPIFNPNLGPEILTAAFGAPLEFSADTSWSVPILHDWSDIDSLRLDPENPHVRTILELTRESLRRGRGKWLTGLTDLHPGGDLVASLRDPQQLCVDLINEPEQVHRLIAHVQSSFFDFYTLQEELIRAAGQTVTTAWLNLFAEGRYYIPSNDFSCMVSTPMFREFFLPELIEETEWLDYSIYHLDGPQALRHLDTLLDMPHLDAIQYVYGAGAGPASRWLDVYQRIQQAGKKLHISIGLDELETFMEGLRPEGVMLQFGAPSVEAGQAAIERIKRWTR